jgi:large subunit ribosomal protein L2
MAINVYKPTTPGRRGMTSLSTKDITTKKPLRSLLVIKKRTNGRNNQGRITTRHRGGGAKRYYRLVNFGLSEGITATKALSLSAPQVTVLSLWLKKKTTRRYVCHQAKSAA